MQFHVLSLFPEIFEPYLNTSILGRAREKKLINTDLYNIRDYATDRHKTVDDTPYGGGAGMVMKIEPIDNALQILNKNHPINNRRRKTLVLSARGQQFTQRKAVELAQLDDVILICGRYEGIDQRVADHLADEELSIGPYVLAGGELPALIIIEAVSRLIPGVLGNIESLTEESYGSLRTENCKIDNSHAEYPQYTKPEDYKGWKVPEVLLSGNHAAIKKWRDEQRKKP